MSHSLLRTLPALLPAALLTTACFIAGCSNSSSAGPPSPGPELAVAEISPTPDTTVSPFTRFVLRFSEPLDNGVLAGPLVVVSDGNGPLPGTEAYNASSSTLVWTPTERLPANARLTVAVPAGLAGMRGAILRTEQSFDFRVSPGFAAAPVALAASIPNADLHVAMYRNGDAQIVGADRSWRLGLSGTFVAPEAIPAGPSSRITGLTLDAQTRAAALVIESTVHGPQVGLSRRSGSGVWSPPELVVAPAAGLITEARLLGNENGDLLVHATRNTGQSVEDILRWSLRDTVDVWLDVPPPVTAPWSALFAAMDNSGRVTTMHITTSLTNFVLVDRYDLPAPTVTNLSIGAGPSLLPIGLAVSVDGRTRVAWHDAFRGTFQRTAPAGGQFGPEEQIDGPPVGFEEWYVAPTGAVIATQGNRLYRSEAGSADWAIADLPYEPLAIAMSPRGEMVAIHFELPDVWSIVRWRAGEPIDSPVPIANVASPFNAARAAAIGVNRTGRVVAVILPEVGGELFAVRVD